jgi:hypothetical protein
VIELFDIELVDFDDLAGAKAAVTLSISFGIPMELSEMYVRETPVRIKQGATPAEADRYVKLLAKLGATVRVIGQFSQTDVTYKPEDAKWGFARPTAEYEAVGPHQEQITAEQDLRGEDAVSKEALIEASKRITSERDPVTDDQTITGEHEAITGEHEAITDEQQAIPDEQGQVTGPYSAVELSQVLAMTDAEPAESEVVEESGEFENRPLLPSHLLSEIAGVVGLKPDPIVPWWHAKLTRGSATLAIVALIAITARLTWSFGTDDPNLAIHTGITSLFRVQLPDDHMPILRHEGISQMGLGNYWYTTYSRQSPDHDGAMVMAAFIDLDFEEDAREETLQRVISRSVAQLGCDLLETSPALFRGGLAIDVSFLCESNGLPRYGRGRAVLVDRDIIWLTRVARTQQVLLRPETRAFFDSLTRVISD